MPQPYRTKQCPACTHKVRVRRSTWDSQAKAYAYDLFIHDCIGGKKRVRIATDESWVAVEAKPRRRTPITTSAERSADLVEERQERWYHKLFGAIVK